MESVQKDPAYRDRAEGCLLGGAVGDALGYPIEFDMEKEIFSEFGPEGIQTLSSCIDHSSAAETAPISDDTQMTLFAANALIWHAIHGGALRDALWLGYREWLGTQGDRSLMDDPKEPKMWICRIPEMNRRRAPGNTCLFAISTSLGRGTADDPVNDSKGCGTVMRAAPFGLAWRENQDTPAETVRERVIQAAVDDAALTHGHPLAHGSSAALALLVYEAVNHRERYGSLAELSAFVIHELKDPRWKALRALLERALLLAGDRTIPVLQGIHQLGEGWIAEEAVAISLFCAVRFQDDFASAVRASVNHRGDSDTTGAVCGNILGAWLGREAVEKSMDLSPLELKDTVIRMADDLIACAGGIDLSAAGAEFGARYP